MKHPLVAVKSPNSVSETALQLQKLLTDRGIKIFACIDHSAAASDSGLELQGETVVVFGDPKVGTFLMQECPPLGFELPLKMLIWQEQESQETYIGFREPLEYIEQYGVVKHKEILEKISKLMHTLLKEVTC